MVMMLMLRMMRLLLAAVDFDDDAYDAYNDDEEGEDAEGDEENEKWIQPAGSQNWAKQHVPGDFTLINFIPITIHHHHHFGLVIVLLSFPLFLHITFSETPGIAEVNKECSPLPSIPMGQRLQLSPQ